MKTCLLDVYEVFEIEEKNYLYAFLFSHGKKLFTILLHFTWLKILYTLYI